MSQEFVMPAEPEELWLADSDLPVKAQHIIDFTDSCSPKISDVAEGLIFKLCDRDPLCVVEQQNFDQLCSIVRCFDGLPVVKRRQLIDALCSSLTCLMAWINRVLANPADSLDLESLGGYRSAFKAYLFYLQWISKIAAQEAREAAASATVSLTGAGTGKGRGKKKAADESVWDWPSQYARVMNAVGQSLNTDLWALFRPNRPDQTVLLKLIQLATAALGLPAAAKDEELAGGAAHILAVTAIKYQQLDSVAAALVDALNGHEHTPPLVAELLRYSMAQWDDGRLAAAVIADVAAVDPAEYERQQNATGEKAGVRSVAAFVEEMASRAPRFMAGQIALMLPHFGGKAWTLRSGIVTAVGYLLHKAFDASASEAADAQGAAARLRSKQHLLEILCERIRDQSSFTRKAVLQTWQYLAEHRAIPLGHWQVVTEMAIGRLEDKSSLVRKEALRLLGALMLHNPFGPALPVDRFVASLQVHKAMLEQVMPPESGVDAGNDNFSTTVPVQEGYEGAPNEEDGEDAEMMDAEDQSGDIIPPVVHEEEAPQARSRSPAEVGWDGSVEELQALVASLELAVDFARSLAGCMPTLVQLLASATVSDVQEAVAMLLTCKQFEVAGAPDAIRKMLPLVFARDSAVKDRIVEALDQLYVTGWAGNTFTSAQAARNLIELSAGATLGELGSLEEVVKEFMNKNIVSPVTIHELWEVAERAGAAVAVRARGWERARRDLRAAFAVLSMAAACRPDVFGHDQVATLLRLGFASEGGTQRGGCSDALTVRHACAALQRLADTLATHEYDDLRDHMFGALVRTVVVAPVGDDASWFSAAEAAIGALYMLHPAPEHICAAILRRMATTAFLNVSSASPQGSTQVPASALSRFFFVLGHVALQHLVLIERSTKTVRKARLEAEKQAAEEKATAPKGGRKKGAPDENEDINAELGVGSVAADAELDAMKEASEAQILSANGLLGPYARMVATCCRDRTSFARWDANLRSSALLALSKLMIVDAETCEANLQLVFTLLQIRSVEPGVRSNLVIALGDLALRFPNVLEPWTEHIYRPLGDPDTGVRKNTMMVLTHLILNDMMKVKGHIAKMAVCLEDEDERIAALAQLFFHELAKKEYKGTSPIYNLLPDILSNLSREPGLSRTGFQSVMQRLLGYIKKDKQGDSLVEKLCQRFAATEDPMQWRNVAFCLGQLPLSEKGLRKLSEGFKSYKMALADRDTAEIIGGVIAKAKKNASKPEVKALMEDLEAKIDACAAERAEEEATAAAAEQRAAQEGVGGVADRVNSPVGNGDVMLEDTAMEESDQQSTDAGITHEPKEDEIFVKHEEQEERTGVRVKGEEEHVEVGPDKGDKKPRQTRHAQMAKEKEAVPKPRGRVKSTKAAAVVEDETSAPTRRSARAPTRRSKAARAVDSEGGEDHVRIAAVQAGIAAITMEDC